MHIDGESLDKKFISKGDEVFHEGDPGDAAYIVETGSVGIFKNIEGEEVHLATMNDGELFGEMAIIDILASLPGTGLLVEGRLLAELLAFVGTHLAGSPIFLSTAAKS